MSTDKKSLFDNTEAQNSLKQLASQFGNKAANLIELRTLSESISKKLNISVSVPDFLSLPHSIIKKHLDLHAPTFEKKWQEFIRKQQEQKNQMELNSDDSDASSDLAELRKMIMKVFNEHPLSNEITEEFIKGMDQKSDKDKKSDMDQKSLIMVRSTGREDAVDLANWGGCESHPAYPTNQSISNRIGLVLASYFSEKSLKQQLLANKSIPEELFVPVLLQKMSGEPVNGSKKLDDIVCSGVMYTHQDGTRIQVAPGHGELIVNGKGAFDTYFVSRENIVHTEIHSKENRMVTTEKEADGQAKVEVDFRHNPVALRNTPTISTDIAKTIADIGREIEAHYGMPMDVEFVYHPKLRTFHLVQARPLTKGDERSIKPSSFPPEKIPEVRQLAGAIVKGAVITASGSAAKVITDKSEILICEDMQEALSSYLAQKNSKVKAVIVKKYAPSTSHEAAVFRSKAIPVIQLEHSHQIEQCLQDPKPCLIVDPQRNQVVDWGKNVRNHETAQKELFELGLLKEGLFKSPLPPRASLLPIFERDFEKEMKIGLEKSFDPNLTLGDLIARVKLNDGSSNRAFNQLFSCLYTLLPSVPPKFDKEHLYSTLKSHIEQLEAAQPGSDNKNAFEALSNITNIIYRLSKSIFWNQLGKHKALLQHAMVYSAEIYRSLKEIAALRLSPGDPLIAEKQMAYLDLVSQLDALITDPGTKIFFTDSIKQIAQDNKILEEARRKEPEFKELSEEAQTYYLELIKFKKSALSHKAQDKWQKFVLHCCKQAKRIQKIAHLVDYYFRNGIESEWLNIAFINKMKEVEERFKKRNENLNAKQFEWVFNNVLEELFIESQQTAEEIDHLKIDEKRAILASWERRIGEWSSPDKFDKLFQEYQAKLKPLIESISFDPKMSPLSNKANLNLALSLVDIIDKTIKSLKGSPEYEKFGDKKLKRFILLLEDYYRMMEKWLEFIPESQYKAWSENMDTTRMDGKFNEKAYLLPAIKSAFSQCIKNASEKDFMPSGNLNVSSATIDARSSFKRQFVDNMGTHTLEDLFSLFHQNILAAIQYFGRNTQIKEENLPEAILPLVQGIRNLKIYDPQYNKTIHAELLNITVEYPITRIEFNLPLRNHSAKYTISYDQNSGKVELKGNMFGVNRENRMTSILNLAAFIGRLAKLKTQVRSHVDASSMSIEFTYDFDVQEINELSTPLSTALFLFAAKTLATEENRKYLGLDNMNAAFLQNVDAHFLCKCFDQLDDSTRRDFATVLPFYSAAKFELKLNEALQNKENVAQAKKLIGELFVQDMPTFVIFMRRLKLQGKLSSFLDQGLLDQATLDNYESFEKQHSEVSASDSAKKLELEINALLLDRANSLKNVKKLLDDTYTNDFPTFEKYMQSLVDEENEKVILTFFKHDILNRDELDILSNKVCLNTPFLDLLFRNEIAAPYLYNRCDISMNPKEIDELFNTEKEFVQDYIRLIVPHYTAQHIKELLLESYGNSELFSYVTEQVEKTPVFTECLKKNPNFLKEILEAAPAYYLEKTIKRSQQKYQG